MKSFFDQFNQCKKENLVGKGKFLSFAENPHLLPFPASKMLATAVKDGSFKGLQTSCCLRFGGDCSSGNELCKNLRNK